MIIACSSCSNWSYLKSRATVDNRITYVVRIDNRSVNFSLRGRYCWLLLTQRSLPHNVPTFTSSMTQSCSSFRCPEAILIFFEAIEFSLSRGNWSPLSRSNWWIILWRFDFNREESPASPEFAIPNHPRRRLKGTIHQWGTSLFKNTHPPRTSIVP